MESVIFDGINQAIGSGFMAIVDLIDLMASPLLTILGILAPNFDVIISILNLIWMLVERVLYSYMIVLIRLWYIVAGTPEKQSTWKIPSEFYENLLTFWLYSPFFVTILGMFIGTLDFLGQFGTRSVSWSDFNKRIDNYASLLKGILILLFMFYFYQFFTR
jgi:hypothetical protein